MTEIEREKARASQSEPERALLKSTLLRKLIMHNNENLAIEMAMLSRPACELTTYASWIFCHRDGNREDFIMIQLEMDLSM